LEISNEEESNKAEEEKKSMNEKKIRERGKKEQGIPKKTCKMFEGFEKINWKEIQRNTRRIKRRKIHAK
jgi:hypothetical protein